MNAAWPRLFFTAHDKRRCLGLIVLLDVAIASEVAVLSQEDRRAAGLLTPNLAWRDFATALNAAVGQPPR